MANKEISIRIQEIIHTLIGNHRGAMSEFAAKIGIKSGQVSQWINGIADPGVNYREKMCSTFNVSREWLDHGKGEMIKNIVNYDNQNPCTSASSADTNFVPAPLVSEREIGRLEGEIKGLLGRIEGYERQIDRYERRMDEMRDERVMWGKQTEECCRLISKPHGNIGNGKPPREE